MSITTLPQTKTPGQRYREEQWQDYAPGTDIAPWESLDDASRAEWEFLAGMAHAAETDTKPAA